MITNSNGSTRFLNVLNKVFTDSSLEQVKRGITDLLKDKSNLQYSGIDTVYAYVFFSEKDSSIVCKSELDIFSDSEFYKDGSRKKDNFIYIAQFEIKKSFFENDCGLDLFVDKWIKESFSGAVSQELLRLQNSINSVRSGSEGSHRFCVTMSSIVIPPLDFFYDQQLKIVLMDKMFSDYFILKDNKGHYTFSQESVKRLLRLKDEIISEFLDDLRNNRNNRSFQFFLQVIMRFKKMDYLSNTSFYSLLETVFNEDVEIWKDLNHFISNVKFYEEKRMLTSFPVNSKEELESLINLLKASSKLYFPTTVRKNLFFSSPEIMVNLLEEVKSSDFIPDDFQIFGIKKKHLSTDALYRYYRM